MTRMQQNVLDDLIRWHNSWLNSIAVLGNQLWLPDADLSGLNLSGRDIAFSNLRRVTLDGANLVEANLARASLDGASLYHANLRKAVLTKATLHKVQANHVQLVESNLTRCELNWADLSGASLDRAILTKAILFRADLRGCSMRDARFERLSLDKSVFGEIDATGASGSILVRSAFWETDGERQELDPEQFIAALQAAGAGEITAVAPRSPEDGIWKV